MISAGQKLYEMWQAAMIYISDCSSDGWYELSAADRAVWERVGEQIDFR